MRYRWDINKLKIAQTHLNYSMEEFTDKEVLSRLKEIYNMYNSMIKLTTKTYYSFSSFCDSQSGYNLKDLIYSIASSYEEDKLPIINLLLQSFPIVDDWKLDHDLNNMYIKATNDDLIDITYSFLKLMTPDYILKDFYKLLDKEDRINISYSKERAEYAGITLIDPISKERYIHINRSNRLTDILSLPHEFFHYIFLSDNTDLASLYNTYFLIEVEGMFANILFGDYQKQVGYKENNFFKEYYKNTFKQEIDELVIRNTLLGSYDGDKINYEEMNKELYDYDIESLSSEEEIIPYLLMPEDIQIKYALSYLVAIDLYYIYLDDREKAFYLLKNIKSIIQEDDILTLLRKNDITFMDDNYNNLKRYLKI